MHARAAKEADKAFQLVFVIVLDSAVQPASLLTQALAAPNPSYPSVSSLRIREYRAWRADQKVGPATLNAEFGILCRIMKRAKLWARVADDIRPLKEPATIGRALTEEDKQRLLKAAVMRHEWETAYLAAILCLNTTARGCELKALQWLDVDLFGRTQQSAHRKRLLEKEWFL